METLRKAIGAMLSMAMVAAAAMAAGAALMLTALFLVGLVDWTGGERVAAVDARGVVEDGRGERQEAPKQLN